MSNTKFQIKKESDFFILKVVIDNNTTKVTQNIKCASLQEAEEIQMDIKKINHKLNNT